MTGQHVDVLIIGAGVSGIGAACHLVRECPGVSLRILERRHAIGGTWDLFRYPGVRSDSDMFTFGYSFRPWTATQVLAAGDSIREYVTDTAREYGVDAKITFGVQVTGASWSSEHDRWTVHTRDEDGAESTCTAGFLIAGTGYYDYDHGYRPQFPGEEQFGGTVVHPQFWPDDLDCRGKRVVIIGSGATAVTIVPAIAAEVEHVTMLQRTPSYILALPSVDKIAALSNRLLPDRWSYRLSRKRNILAQQWLYTLARKRPKLFRKMVDKGAARHLAGSSDLANFRPSYDPWDQRLCVVPDGDLFAAVRSGRADIVTDTIDTFTPTGIRLRSGRELPADIVVTATGLSVQLLGGARLDVDGVPVAINDTVTYKGVLLDGVPNAGLIFGYINASWTLKADLAAEYLCRLINHMRSHGYTQAVVHATPEDRGAGTVFGPLDSGYVRRAASVLPRQGTRGPWKVTHSYLRDVPMLRKGELDDGLLQFSGAHQLDGGLRPPAPDASSTPA